MTTVSTFLDFQGFTRRLPGRFRFLLALAALSSFSLSARAQVALNSAAPTTITFDEMGADAKADVPAGFQLANGSAPAYDGATNTTATTVAANGNNFTTGGAYNFAAEAGSADRALGFLTSGSYTAPRHILLAIRNTTGAVIQDLNVQFAVEKYRANTRAIDWETYTSPDGSSWTAQPAATLSFAGSASAYSYPPISTPGQAVLTGVNLAPNAVYYLRWTYRSVDGSSTNGQGLGLDDVVLTPTLAGGTAPTPAATITTAPSAFNSPYCITATTGSAPFDVAYSTAGTFTGTYKVQLSDATGTFPTNTTAGIIGTGTSSPISATIPANTTSGTGYRVRVVNDAPATYGSDNGSDLTINLASTTNEVAVTPAGSQSISLTGTGTTLTAAATAGSTYTWHYGTSAAGPFETLLANGPTYQPDGSDFGKAGTYYVVANATVATTCGTANGQSAPIAITVSAPQPEITASVTTLPDFGSIFTGSASAAKSFTVSGSGLTAPLIVTPPAGFEIRTGTQPFACCAISLPPSNGTVYPTTIEVRFAPTLSQPYQAAVTVASTGFATQSVAVSGTSTAPVYPATVSTTALTEIKATSATTGGTIEPDGGSAVTARGVVWAQTPNPVLGTLKTTDGTGSGAFTSTITGLTPGTTYYVRAYATNNGGTAYGDELTLTTVTVPLAAEPTKSATPTATKTTSAAIALQLTGGTGTKHLVLAHLNGAVDAQPVDATTYTDSTSFGLGTQVGTGNYVVYAGTNDTVTVRNLRPGTSYSFAVFDYNDNDTPYAENYYLDAPGTLTQSTKPVPSLLLLEENFDYPAGALLTDNNWKAHSGAGTNAVTVTAGSLSYAGYGASGIGNAAALKTSGEDVNRQFASIYARTPVYVSFLVNVAATGTAGDYFFHLGPTVLSTTYKTRVYAKRGSSTSKVVFGISGNGSSANIIYTTTEYDVNTPYLLVVKYVFDENGSTSQLFINPALDAEPATAAATSTETSSSPNDIGSVALRQGTAASAPTLTVDGIRVGTSYKAVRTGITCEQPAPSFAATTVCVGAATAFTDASQTVEDNATYAWDFDGDGKVDNTTAGNVSFTYAAAGTYKATLTITQGTCSDVFTKEVTVRALPTATLAGNATICAGESATLTVHLTGMAPWMVSYSADGGTTATPVTVAATDVTAEGNYLLTVKPAATTTYSLTAVTDANCTGATPTGTAQVTVNTTPTLTVPTTLTATAAYGQNTAPVEFAATATGAPAPVLTYSIVKAGATTPITSPYSFPVGTTTVTATATNSCGAVSKTFDVTVKSTAASVSVLHQNGNKKPDTNTIRPNLQLRNESTAAIPYSELTVRYWLTAEDYSALQGAIDYAQVGTGNVQVRYVPLAQPVQGAFGYAEYSFSAAAGSLAVGSTSGPIQSRLYKQAYTSFNELDDYSYAANSAYAQNAHITVYRNGALVGGVEPTAVPEATRLTALTQNTGGNPTSNIISTTLQLRNEGNTPVSYADLTVRYWLSSEGTAPLNTTVDYAVLGNNNVRFTTGKAGTETYVELHFAAGLGSFAPLSSTGNVQYRTYKADWSAFNQANDYSYLAKSSALAENQHVTVYLKGQLVYGQEPAGALSATATSSSLTLNDAAAGQAVLRNYPNPFTGSTTLEFSLPQDEAYQLDVYDASGRLVQHLKAGTAAAGQLTQVEWQAGNLAAGLYTARLTTGHAVQHLKLMKQ